MIRIYDGNNYFRVAVERDPTGLAPRQILEEIKATKDVVIWVWDGKNGNSKRRELYPEYKRNRPPMAEDFRHAMQLMKDLLAHSTAIQIEVPGYEGDDVIATLARRYSPVSIYSNDFDYMQLVAERPGKVFCGANLKAGVEPKYVRLFKTLVGDPSDNIKGVKLFGKKTWDEADKEKLLEAVLRWVHQGVLLESDLPRSSMVDWVEDNLTLVRTYWQIVGFYDVPIDLIEEHTQRGSGDWYRAENLLSEFML
ncbi:hypothetical protein IZ6_24630 [Terrihabitans soli]|uniref:5'-3' exonuclease domain-containing protein n=1 Tax=Terrihabitans soli TaxID=708113 RepID=A0A6S6QYR3_9HYPH|nr:hypothetical protein [Terrihabitans soli]BCJ91728.1 hypothetical protein IZ6_24630 [Terrihabitans soli]